MKTTEQILKYVQQKIEFIESHSTEKSFPGHEHGYWCALQGIKRFIEADDEK